MAYPIKYIENNLVFNHDGECFAYYELLPYNYSFLSPEQKYQVHDSFRQLIAQNRDGKIHALQISTESSIRAAQERSKQEVTGKLKDVACAKIDAQTEALISMIGENQVDYRFFIGFKLLVNEQEVTMKQFRREAKTAVSDFLHEVKACPCQSRSERLRHQRPCCRFCRLPRRRKIIQQQHDCLLFRIVWGTGTHC